MRPHVPLKLRLPPDLHADLVRRAEVANVSLNSLICEHLRRVTGDDRVREIVREEINAAATDGGAGPVFVSLTRWAARSAND